MSAPELVVLSRYFTLNIFNQKLFAYLLAGISLFTPLNGVYAITVMIILTDMITGLIKSYYKGGWANISSKKLKRTGVKIIVYHLLISVTFGFVHFLISPNLALSTTKYSLGLVMLTEMFSIYENISQITGNKRVSQLKKVINNLLKGENGK